MASARDEVARRPSSRPDPRADPDSVPKMRAVKAPPEERGGLRDEVAETARRRDPRVDPESMRDARLPAPGALPREAEEVDVEVRESAPAASDDEPPRASAAPANPRFAEVDPLIDRGAWKEIVDKLALAEAANDLPPSLALIYALARREAAGEEAAPGATPLAIKSMAALLGVAEDSASALVLAKRMLRQNPAAWHARKAPSAGRSALIVVIAIAVGIAAGSFLSLGAFRSFHLF